MTASFAWGGGIELGAPAVGGALCLSLWGIAASFAGEGGVVISGAK